MAEYKCFFCGGKVVMSSTEMVEDIYPGDYGEDDLFHKMYCEKCGSEYDVVQRIDKKDADSKNYNIM